ncbi:hypothetical protein KO488_00220 [Poseidonibacter lekithochrous]|uniref:hypothetical protein n=1 Tax=Poseidonibacter TaxID=2321187 RepID=UPI001C0926CF|nr:MULTISPECIES: hypothetical protein [Poseidonibacter]MBU3013164.1 hypothetical protein [Poseidonibacter lekithochrous]MDO6826460.1 hypothetical protein [Poseidonibacter sp. 1_MG-2023]
MNVGIYIYDDAEVLDFSVASRFLNEDKKFNTFNNHPMVSKLENYKLAKQMQFDWSENS